MWEKLKSWLADDTFFYTSFFLLVAVTSFGLGRLSIERTPATTNPAAITVSQPLEPADVPAQAEVKKNPSSGATYYVASQNGSKYHLPWCPSAQQINQENIVRFSTAAAAEAKGYTPAANCPGL